MVKLLIVKELILMLECIVAVAKRTITIPKKLDQLGQISSTLATLASFALERFDIIYK